MRVVVLHIENIYTPSVALVPTPQGTGHQRHFILWSIRNF